MFTYILPIYCLIDIACTINYDAGNATQLFNFYKLKFDKIYKSKAKEHRAFRNFINNLNKVTSLNEKTTNNYTYYILNRYADIDPQDIDNHYALPVTPYDDEPKGDIKVDKEKELMREKTDKALKPKELYDLTKADELFEEHLKKYKKSYTKKHDRLVHYYRFIKTLVDINTNHFKGNYNVTLNEDADVLKEPNEYFY